MVDGPRFEDIKNELKRRIDSLVRELAPGGRMQSGYYFALNPRRGDRHVGSFCIKVRGDAVGMWADKSAGHEGDLIDLVAYCKVLTSKQATRLWCLDWLGWSHGVDRKKLEAARIADRYVAQQDERRSLEELADKRRRAKGWWLNAQPMIEGTLAETYLKYRGIDISKLKSPPRALRFLPKARHIDSQTGEISEWPCMLAAMCDIGGTIVAVHRTYLAADGRGKAPIPSPKKIWPHGYKGAVIRLAKGASGLSPEQAAKKAITGPLGAAEGIENTLTMGLADPALRLWAAGTLGNLAHMPIEHVCVDRVLIFADNDSGPQTRATFDKAVMALREKRQVSVARAFKGKDANDLLRGTT